MIRIIQEVKPDEIYNLAAMSHVHISFQTAEYTANTDALGTLRILEAVRLLGLIKAVNTIYKDIEIIRLSKFIQATIDENEVVDTTYKEFVKILIGFFLITLGTYFFGFMIGWVVKGFKKVKV